MRQTEFNEKRIASTLTAHFHSLLRLLIIGLLLAAVSEAQPLSSRPDRGYGSKGGYQTTDIDSISLQSGSVNVQIPLASLPPIAGGKLSYTLNATYNSKLWDVHRSEERGAITSPGCQPAYSTQDVWQGESGAGWQIGGQYQIFFRDAHNDYDYLPPSSFECYSYDFYHMQGRFFKPMIRTPDGSEHELRIQGYWETYSYQGFREHLKGYYKQAGGYPNYPTINSPLRMYTIDGSYITVIVNPTSSTFYTTTIYLKDGTRIETTEQGQRTIDTNGNSILYGYAENVGFFVRDEQTGREIKWSGMTYNGQQATRVEYQKVGGNWESVIIVWGTTTVQGKIYSKTSWNASGGEFGGGDVCSVDVALPETVFGVIREIILPATEQGANPRKFTFGYNSDTTVQTTTESPRWACTAQTFPAYTRTASYGWGELSDVTTPTGAHIKYNYTNEGVQDFTGYGALVDDLVDQIVKNNITSKVVTHDGTTDTWTYSIAVGGGNWVTGGSVINPDGSSHGELYNPTNIAYSGAGGSDGSGGRLVKSNDSGKILTERHWTALGGLTGAIGSVQQVAINSAVDTEYTTLLANDGLTRQKISARKFFYDFNGELTQTIEYDWFDPSTVTYTNPGTYLSMPAGVPASATVLKVINNSYYNQAANASSPYAYQNRALGGTSTVILGALQQTTIGSTTANQSLTQFSYDGFSYGTSPIKGNLTQVSRWDNTNNQWITSGSTYDSYGNALTSTDPKGNVTQFFYEDSTHASITKTIVDPQNGTGQQISTNTFDFYTGLPTSSTDINGNTSSISYFNHLLGAVDPLNRPGTNYDPYINIDGVNKRQTVKFYYEDSSNRTRIESDLFNEGDGFLKSRETRDQLGRTILTENNEDGANSYTISAQIVYKTQDRVILTSNRTRNDGASTDGWTRVTNDTLGRTIETTTFSGAAQPPVSGTNTNWTGSVSIAYSSNTTTVTEQTGKVRRSVNDALGRLVRVDEPNSAGQLDVNGIPALSTIHTYNSLDKLTGITQGGQTRSFVYDTLSRLIQSASPESGTNFYTYDLNGNLKIKTNAANVKTIYDYDALNRPVKRCYTIPNPSGTPTSCSQLTAQDKNQFTLPVTYSYDNLTNAKGKLTKIVTGDLSTPFSVTEYQSFDQLGRILQLQQTTDNVTYNPMVYKYDLSDAIIEETYPSGRVVKNTLDSGGDLQQVQSRKSNGTFQNYANAFKYTISGAVSALRLGNGRWETMKYNSRQQTTQVALGNSSTDSSLLKLVFDYGTSDNNGSLKSQQIFVPTIGGNPAFTAVQTYTYDSLNRLNDAREMIGTNQNWKQTFLYDRYGNRTFDEANTTTLPKNCGGGTQVCPTDRKILNPSIQTINNRLTQDQDGDSQNDYLFDQLGNLTLDALGRTIAYDAENKQIEVKDIQNNTIGQYFFDGEGKRVKKYVPSTGETTIFIYNVLGKMVAEYSTIVAPQSQAKINYLTYDQLGSSRINTDAVGQVTARHDYYPFGEELSRSNYGGDAVKQKFTGYERDVETDLDFAQARMYNSRQGRFNSPDPLLIHDKRLADPQTVNLYAYARNNPYFFTDPSGLDVEVAGTEQEAYLERLRKLIKFKIQLDAKTNKIQIVDDKGKVLDKKQLNALGKTLKGAEKQLFKAITDTKHHVQINTVRRDGAVFFGRFEGSGRNSIDMEDLDVLDGSTNPGFTSEQVVGHETLEAYASSKGKKLKGAHKSANKFFPGLAGIANSERFFGNKATQQITEVTSQFQIQKSNSIVEITREFDPPVPYNNTPNGIVPANNGPVPNHVIRVVRIR